MIDGHECVVLAALMNGTDVLPLNTEDFSSPPNRTIFNRLSEVLDCAHCEDVGGCL